MDLNKLSLIGNLTADPESKTFPNGDVVVRFSVATNRTWRDPNTDEQQKHVEYTAVAARGKLADIVQQYLHKGSRVYVEGRLKTRRWKDKDGNPKSKTELIVLRLIIFGGRQARPEDFNTRLDLENATKPV
ncbi:MAG: single-stranded DNA-binding protein [Candidatus Zixiibacteriota bacterium]